MSDLQAEAGTLDGFAEGVRKELADGQRQVRCFDIGGTGVKTALISSSALSKLLRIEPAEAAQDGSQEEWSWLEPPRNIGFAPGRNGFSEWLVTNVPQLTAELSDPSVIFGIAVKGRIVHETQRMRNWYAGGASVGREEPLIADIMGLPHERTFALHDGSAHLLGCSRSILPPPSLALFALGTGVGFALTDADGRLINRLGSSDHHLLMAGDQVATASYEGAWRSLPSGPQKKVMKRMVGQYGNMVSGRLGYEALGAAREALQASGSTDEEVEIQAVRMYGEQWLHFLHTRFLPEFTGPDRIERYVVRSICFAGGVAEHRWPLLSESIVDASGKLKALPETLSPKGTDGIAAPMIDVLPNAPRFSGLLGAAVYALAGVAGSAQSIWSL